MELCCPCNFIKIEDFYPRVPLSENVESGNILIAIAETQQKYIRPIFCPDLYEELCAQIQAETLSDANEQLLCYIRDIHVRYAFADFIFLQPVRITKESIVRKVSDESEFVDFEVIEKYSQFWRMQAQNYIKPMTDWMDDNTALNPLFDRTACSDCKDSSTSTNSFGFI